MLRSTLLVLLLAGCLSPVAEGDLPPDAGDQCGGCATGSVCTGMPDCHPQFAPCLYACVKSPTPSNAATCTTDADCHKANPDECNICTGALDVLVCASNTCQCACSVR